MRPIQISDQKLSSLFKKPVKEFSEHQIKQVIPIQAKLATKLKKLSRLQKKWQKSLREELLKHHQWREVQDIAIVKLQRFVRGFLVRKKVEPVLVQYGQEAVDYNLFSLIIQADNCVLEAGIDPIEAALTIQRWYKRLIFLRKIKRLKAAYKLYLRSKMERAKMLMNSVLRKYVCQIKVFIMKFDIYKGKALYRIKRRLAVLSVKKYWKKFKLTFGKMMERLNRRRRRHMAMKHTNIYKNKTSSNFVQLNVDSLKLKKKQLFKDEQKVAQENPENQVSQKAEESEGEIQRQKNQAQKQWERLEAEGDKLADEYDKQILKLIELRRIVYNIKQIPFDIKKPIISEPVFHDKLSNSYKIQTVNSTVKRQQKLFKTGKPIRNLQIHNSCPLSYRKGNANSLPPLPTPCLNDSISTPLRSRYFRPVKNERFLTPTKNFLNKFKEHPLSVTPTSRIIPRLKVPRHQNVHSDTLTYQLKKQERIPPSKSNVWNYSRGPSFQYTPCLDNSRYSPVKWKPLPYKGMKVSKSFGSPREPRSNFGEQGFEEIR